MKILHYSLGLPPYRTGGLTKYSHDLMIEQVKRGEEVYLLFPGYFNKLNNTYIKQYSNYNKIQVYEIINPLPVPLLKGIKDPILFMEKVSKEIYIEFLLTINVKIVHIHTFMGLHIEFLNACKKLNIKIIYTTHDYFGLCPKVNFIDSKDNLCEMRNSEKCTICNMNGDSFKKIKILQSRTYRKFKNLGGIDILKNIHCKIKKSSNFLKSKIESKQYNNNLTIDNNKMSDLLEYYSKMFDLVDFFLFNSNITKSVYCRFLSTKGKVIPITHKSIKDNRKIKNYNNETLRVSYLGPNKTYKGINILINTMNSLYKRGYKNIILSLYGDENFSIVPVGNNVINNGKYRYEELEDIFNKTDILVVPSIWYETYGFITLEALSHGVPIILTNKVGSKDILLKNNIREFVIDDDSKILEEKLIEIYKDRSILEVYNKEIINIEFNYLIKKHYEDIKLVYKEILECK